MKQTLLLTAKHIKQCITPPQSIQAVESAFLQYATRQARMPAKMYLDLPQYHGDFRAMPAFLEKEQVCSLKWVNAHAQNHKHDLPAVMAILILNDPQTGFPLSIMDATYTTGLRTGAAGAVAAKYLARPQSSVIAMIGCGVQARMQLLCIRSILPVREVRVWGQEKRMRKDFRKAMRISGEKMILTDSIQEAVEGVDVITTTTPSRKPLIKEEWVEHGVHINAIGADAQGKQELDIRLLEKAEVFVDDWEQAAHSGEVNVAVKKKRIQKNDIKASLGEVIAGRKKGRRTEKEMTIFDSTGLAIQDTALAYLIYKEALRLKKGKYITFF